MPKACPLCGTSYDDTATFCPADGAALRVAGAPDTLVGTVIADRYLVTEALGEGGMGTVYLARHVRLPQQAAIKVMRPEILGDPTALARFHREAAVVATIEHERVVRVYDVGETPDGLVYLAMEFVPGRTLKALLEEAGALAPARAAALVRQVAEGLEAAHRKGIVHRDLKPDNVMVMADPDGSERCKVLDFGIAKPTEGAGEGMASGVTRTGYVLGTPEYMSPEQVLGMPVDARSDVYALALVACQCLTGALPFDTTTPDRGLTARLLHPPRPLGALNAAFEGSTAVQAVFDAALASDVALRTASPLAFAQALAVALREEPGAGMGMAPTGATATATPAVTPPATPTASPPARVGGTTGATTGASAASAMAAIAARQVTPARGADDVEGDGRGKTPKQSRKWLGAVAMITLIVAGGAGYVLSRPAAPAPSDAQPPAPQASATPAPAPQAPTPQAPAPQATVSPTPAPAGAPATAAPTVGPPRQSPATVPSAPPAAVAPLSTAAARARLAELRDQLDPATATEETARRLLPQLRALLDRLPTREDSATALLRLGEAYLLTGENPPACAAWARALGLTRDPRVVSAISNYRHGVSCPERDG
ncbi:MAG: serine/threonine protein kinase [Gemmatimonadetes bacterium]|nr:serine/threonine protein kinase [Gemmatimonadota bacterium]